MQEYHNSTKPGDLSFNLQAVKTILIGGFAAGTLDILATILIHNVFGPFTIERILQFIASGFYGPDAFKGGWIMAIAGLFFHFIIAFALAFFYFIIANYIEIAKSNFLVSGIIYGILVWMVISLMVLPNSKIPTPTSVPTFITQVLSISCAVFFVGVPIAYITSQYYNRKLT